MGNANHADDDQRRNTGAQRDAGTDKGGNLRGHHAAVDENGKPMPPDEHGDDDREQARSATNRGTDTAPDAHGTSVPAHQQRAQGKETGGSSQG